MTLRRLATFSTGGLLLAVDVERVEEVIHGGHVTPVPLADPCVLGLLNIRGRIVTAVDTRRRLGRSPRKEGDAVVHYVVRSGGEAVSLAADREGEVVALAPGDVEAVPSTVGPPVRDLVTGAVRVDEGVLLVLDADRAASVPGT